MWFKKSIDLIFYRMHEPAFIAKGNGDVQQSFSVPDEFIDDRFKALKSILAKAKKENKFNDSDTQEIALKTQTITNVTFVKDVMKRTDHRYVFDVQIRCIEKLLLDSSISF